MPQPKPVVLTLTASAVSLGADLARTLDAAHHRADAAAPTRVTPVVAHIQSLFQAGVPIVGVCAAGILIRALGPLLADKWAEPPVIAVSEDGHAVPLLGGHRGANALARRIADARDGTAAITAAGDVHLGVALDAPPPGWRLERPEDAKAVTQALLAGEEAALTGDAPFLAPLAAPRAEAAPGEPAVLSVEGAPPLVYRRQDLALGIGCVRHADPDAVIALAARTLAENGLAAAAVAGVYSIDLKADETAVHALAAHLGVEARFFPAERLEAETPRLTAPSETVFQEVGAHGVAEAAALAAAGSDGSLLVPKVKTPLATCAIARLGRAPEAGRPQGHLSVVGIGPGDPLTRTPAATQAVMAAEELVGYGLYLDLLGPIAAGKAQTRFDLGEEEARCRYALEAAAEGRRIALISSGDAGIYAMGALVMELLDRGEGPGGVSAAARRVAVEQVPGVSALQAASARAGALLGHDFCAISLSDLLTPRDQILTRLSAAAAGDFVVALYNPVSRRRRTLLAEAQRILSAHRPPDTPVLLASNLGRKGERLRPRTLATLATDEVDMLTVVLIGSSASRAFRLGDGAAGAEGWQIYTPRGYAAKQEAEP